jgi:hypothetical protein
MKLMVYILFLNYLTCKQHFRNFIRMKWTGSINNILGSLLMVVAFINLSGCVNQPENKSHPAGAKKQNPVGYDLSAPDRTIILPPVLMEVSGIIQLDANTVASIEDENGVVFIFDLKNNEIANYYSFHMDGDYEDLTLANNMIYVLRSDGVLFQIENYRTSGHTKKIFSSGIPPANYEGLCFDNINNRLLIIPKNILNRSSEYDGRHPVFGFDLKAEVFYPEPVLEFDLEVIKKFAAESMGFSQVQGKSTGPPGAFEIMFRPSALGINPATGKLFILSAVEHLMFIFNMNGDIEYIGKLDPEIFNSPEGITFFDNGDLLISNEGKTSPPNILRFNYKLNY